MKYFLLIFPLIKLFIFTLLLIFVNIFIHFVQYYTIYIIIYLFQLADFFFFSMLFNFFISHNQLNKLIFLLVNIHFIKYLFV